MSKGIFSKSNETRRAGRKVINPTSQDLILKETFKKETRHVKLYTEFSPNYVKMGDIVTGKITNIKDKVLVDASFEDDGKHHGAADGRIGKRGSLTTSGEYGSFTGPSATRLDHAPLWHARVKCDVTRLAESQMRVLRALRRSNNAAVAKEKQEISEDVVDSKVSK